MICKECGKQIPDEAVFCPNCGAIVNDEDLEATGLLTEDDDGEATGLLSEDEPAGEYNRFVSQEQQNNSAYVNTAFTQTQQAQTQTQFNDYYQSQQSWQTQQRPNNGYYQSEEPSSSQNQYYNQDARIQNGFSQPQVEKPTLINCYKKFWKNYANFNGRARRSEYWFVFLANALINFVFTTIAGVVMVAAGGTDYEYMSTGAMVALFIVYGLISLYGLAIFLPSLSLLVRRLHDIGKEWYYIFFNLIPLVGGIIVLVWMFTDSQPGPNKFGENPKGINQPVNYQ